MNRKSLQAEPAPGISGFIDHLRHTPGSNLFNPWFERDRRHDATAEAPAIRRRQLRAYLSERTGRAKYLFIAEALGYQGGHFTGIAMTSERILLGHQREKYRVRPEQVFNGLAPERTSSPAVNAKGLSEPTATIMWGTLIELGIDPYEVVLWNAVPWHPFDPGRGLLSNRTPGRQELKAGLKLLKAFLQLFEKSLPVAVGKKCEQTLTLLGIDHLQVRHPANGGAPAFRRQVREIMSRRDQF